MGLQYNEFGQIKELIDLDGLDDLSIEEKLSLGVPLLENEIIEYFGKDSEEYKNYKEALRYEDVDEFFEEQ